MQSNSISIRIKNRLLQLSSPLVMGILNVTPDSFYAESRTDTTDAIINRAQTILEEGGTIIDIGGYSTRPFAMEVCEKEELDRLSLALAIIRERFPDAIISVDTYRANIADYVIRNFEVDIINDVSGGTLDRHMDEVIAFHQVPYILMHMKGTPQTMQQFTNYKNLFHEVSLFFTKRIQELSELGVNDIIIDPGFGFAKTTKQNFDLLRHLSQFTLFEKPILVGLSRKSMLFKTLNTDPSHSLPATIAANTIALMSGASILRVHDVKEAVQTIKTYENTFANPTITDQ
ncbi:dihydropteroate synthase [Microbacter margulisiae]|uniref:dihydropteroate synthase n=1 Tax=Microbacter margulisiae TaxID=1350067 RepID=A0A7W5H2P5_9PORP|nr:dihydropteroate synthase [Microbacter margulisiae]MBB3188000.1 dihydropteroate synthase [Microbacter margulisiae]